MISKNEFVYDGPWWLTGYRDVEEIAMDSICFAIRTENEEEVENYVVSCRSKGALIEWRFIEEQSNNWNPVDPNFSNRFKSSSDMQWPWPPLP